MSALTGSTYSPAFGWDWGDWEEEGSGKYLLILTFKSKPPSPLNCQKLKMGGWQYLAHYKKCDYFF